MALMVGVSGVRGLVGQTLTPELVLDFARAYGTFLEGGRVVLARDSRPSGSMYAAAAAAGLLAAGCEVTDLGVAMTPTVGRAIVEGEYMGGISITASHNPAGWNGVKFFNRSGFGPSAEQAGRVAQIRAQRNFREVREGFRSLRHDREAGQRHVRAVLAAREVDTLNLRGVKAVLDSVNGAGCEHTPALLKGFGLDLVHINSEPTGEFAHPPEPVGENLTQLCQSVQATRAAIGFAQDPDADRLAIVDENGVYIGEEYTLALAVESVLSRRPGPVAANLSTSRMVDDIAARYGVKVVRTPVGEANVAGAMVEAGCVVGGEGNGGVIDPRICMVRDSLSAISLVLQLLAASGKSVSELVGDLPRYSMLKQKFECRRERVEAAVGAITEKFADYNPTTTDGVRVDFPAGWVHVRASNTEPIIRIIAEATSLATAGELTAQVRQAAGL
jgi:phosphomannomutase